MSSTPHDALFKATFSRTEHAAGVLRTALPPAILARLDLTTLALLPGSFVDEELASRHTDLLFSVALDGRRAFVYVLFEHQRTVDALMAFRLLRYMVRAWEHHLADHPDAQRLPAILPLVLHHSEGGWRAEVAFEALLDVDPATLAAIGEHVPRFRFVLDDLSAETDEALMARAMTGLGRLVFWCFRHAHEPEELIERLAGLRALLREVAQAPDGAAVLALVWRYILTISEPRRPEELLARLLQAAAKEGEEEIVNVADWLREQGRNEGLVEGQRKTLLKLLAARFGALPEAVVGRIQGAGVPQLDVWTERVLTAPTLNDALADG